MCRGGRGGEFEEYLVDSGMTGSGWPEVPDLSSARSFQDVRSIVAAAFPDASSRAVGNWSGQLWSLRGLMSEGDFVLMPRRGQGSFAIGVIAGPYRFDGAAQPGYQHVRPVNWKAADVPKTSFGPDLRRSLGTYMTICEIRRDDVAARVDALASGQQDPKFAEHEGDGDGELDGDDVEAAAAVSIQELIRTRFPGHDLAVLVEAVLRANGYETRLSPPGPDQGVDVLAARGGLGFEGPRIAIQVKNSGAAQGVPVLNELLGAQSAFGAERALFVSWGGFTAEAARMARTKWFDLRLWTADELVAEVTAVYDQLPEAVRARLPLKQVWTAALPDEAQ
jgi:restriction system protein